MKKSKIVVLFILGFVLGALAAVGVYFLTVGEVAWQEYVETKLIPNVVLALSAISALCVAALPIISKIQVSVAKFNQATSDVNATVENGKKTDEKLAEQDQKIEAFSERFEKPFWVRRGIFVCADFQNLGIISCVQRVCAVIII